MAGTKRTSAETPDRPAKQSRLERPAFSRKGLQEYAGKHQGSKHQDKPEEAPSSRQHHLKVAHRTGLSGAAAVAQSQARHQHQQQQAGVQHGRQQHNKHQAAPPARAASQQRSHLQQLPSWNAGRQTPDKHSKGGHQRFNEAEQRQEEDSDDEDVDSDEGAGVMGAGRMSSKQYGQLHSKQHGSDASDDGEVSNDGDSEAGDEGSEHDISDEGDDIPFEVLERLRQDGAGPSGAAARAAAVAAKKVQASFHRDNRHRPSEQSSKRPVGRYREVIQVPNRQPRDPRFPDEATIPGAARAPLADVARKRYAFVYDEMLPEEKKALQARIKKERTPAAKASLQAELTRINQLVDREKQRRKSADVQGQWKGQERAAVAAGKAPFYLKKSERKRLELLAKYQQLSAKGQVDKFIEKRRKKNASKDHRYLPERQQQ